MIASSLGPDGRNPLEAKWLSLPKRYSRGFPFSDGAEKAVESKSAYGLSSTSSGESPSGRGSP